MPEKENNYDPRLEEDAQALVSRILASGLHRDRAALAFGTTPLFLCHGGLIVPGPLRDILRFWETDPDNNADDEEFIKLLRRTDLPPGSFFVLYYPERRRGYHWVLHEPEPEAAG